ncbi:hypothetical protein MMC19_003396 [Ptychographa xylographoides]|nr:hypothetical protein [Ptychographa xylographoides]
MLIEGRKVAYFRGRKLFGREVKLRDDYRGMQFLIVNRKLHEGSDGRTILTQWRNIGVVVGETDRTLPQSSTINNSGSEAQGPQMSIPAKEEEEEEEEEEELDEDETEPVKILEEVAVFDKIVVWGHEQIPDDEDIFVRGVEEWIDFAEAIHTVHDSQSEPSG